MPRGKHEAGWTRSVLAQDPFAGSQGSGVGGLLSQQGHMTSIGRIPHGEGDLEWGGVLPEEMEMRVRTQTVSLGKRWSMCA